MKSLAARAPKGLGRAVDVADPAALKAWLEAAASELGSIDSLIRKARLMGSQACSSRCASFEHALPRSLTLGYVKRYTELASEAGNT